MAYATKDQIKSLFRDFADNTEAAVNDDDLDLFIDNSTELIDSRVGEYYTLPITEVDSPKAFKMLRQVQMYQVACIVDDILNSYEGAEIKPGWCKKANMLLSAIAPENEAGCKKCEPTTKLGDASYIGSPSERNTIKVSNIAGPTFVKGVDKW